MSVPAPGQVIDRYQVVGTIGAGSMGDVVKATDIDLKRTVAIKILSDKHRGNEELEARFVREGRAVAAISHANVVQVFTTGTWDERPYIAMEFLTGTDLGSLVAQQGPMSSLDSSRVVLDTARGLEAAYLAGLVHRDVKPANLVKLDNGQTKVTDFGLAKPVDPKNEPALTAMGVVVGTPDYIAPEQARGEAIDEKVDIYSLGGTLYYLLVGKPPFRKGNTHDDKYLKVVARHLRDPAPNPLLVVPDADSELARLLLRMMSKKPEARPSYAELVVELADIVERLGGRTTPPPTTSRPSQSGDSRPGPSAKTPYIGGNRQGTDVSRLAGQSQPENTHAHLDDGAETHVHLSSQDRAVQSPSQALQPSKHSSQRSAVAETKRSKVLDATTVVSAAVFIVGLVLYLAGPMPSPSAAAPLQVAADTAPIAVVALPPDAAPAPPEAPLGTFLIPASSLHKAIFMSKDLVTHEEFAAIFPNQKKPTKKKSRALKPASGVEFSYARAYAQSKGARLPTPEEYTAALAMRSEDDSVMATSKSLWEWLDDGAKGSQAMRQTGNAKGAIRAWRSRAKKNIGFRLVIDP
ncbi:MAG: serine/threonine protein kinase [Myxococcales bacterium]|nr:serine/threonine protein kinase [Myxococcales bacterium]